MAYLLTLLRSGADGAAGRRLEALAGTLVQLSRYSAASMLALALDFSVYLLLTAGHVKPVLAGVLGYGAGLALHFLLSVRFVFVGASTSKAQARLFGEFALSGLAGIATTAVVMALATGVAGLPGLPAKVLAAFASFLLVYWLRRTIVFAPSPNRTPLA
jgi:putative flippase GtrA